MASTVTPAGTKTVGSVTAIKIDVSTPAGTVTFSGSAARLQSSAPGVPQFVVITLGTGAESKVTGFSVSEPAETGNGILSVVSSSNTFVLGEEDVLDTQGCPTTFSTRADSKYTKQ